MIRALRRRHRTIVSLLAVALPLLGVAGLVARRPIPAQEPLPEALGPSEIETPAGAPRSRLSWPGGALTLVRLSATELVLEPQVEIAGAELLVYWTVDAPAPGGNLPAESWLLGRVDGARACRLTLPSRAQESAGSLVLYDLAHQTVVATTELRGGAP